MTENYILSVSQLNFYIKSIIDADRKLFDLYVSGEISNFTRHFKTGHLYFTLKDESSSLKAVMFSRAAERLRFMPENGMKVTVRGRVSVFERDGTYQLYAETIEAQSEGELAASLEKLKQKLQKEGLFDESRKRPIPRFPKKVGVITSASSAAIHDILTVLARRWPLSEVVFCPASVEGIKAVDEITAAIKEFNSKKAADVLIVGRGGGSVEELWTFNDERIARAVAASEIPIISAVGHESDYTLIDFAADLRAPTPSAAAELAVPERAELLHRIRLLEQRLSASADELINSKTYNLTLLYNRLLSKEPTAMIESRLQTIDSLRQRLNKAGDSLISEKQHLLSRNISMLDALSPLKILGRGYAIAVSAEEETKGRIIKTVTAVKIGDKIDVNLTDGVLKCNILETKEL
ncbi:MAG: exodeoxyribonuclease VII large subunit [Clostridiales bacterium]|nr:exodeoxyribonuclease VII large subunit [Clostridiales bacterium]